MEKRVVFIKSGQGKRKKGLFLLKVGKEKQKLKKRVVYVESRLQKTEMETRGSHEPVSLA